MPLPDPIAPGFYYDIPDADYRKAPGMPQSRLKPILRSPAHFMTELTTPFHRTDLMLCGQVIHHLVLTPNVMPFWVVKPDGLDGRTKEGKDWNKAHEGEDAVSFDDFRNVRAAADAVLSNDTAMMALGAGRCEVSAFAKFDLCGIDLMMKGRLDFLNDGPSIVDLKFTEDAREHAWARKIEDMLYDFQAAYYLDIANLVLREAGLPQKRYFVHIVVERDPPYGIRVYTLDDETVAIGRYKYAKAVMLHARCCRENYWPKYKLDVTTIGLPGWVKRTAIAVHGWHEIAALPVPD